MRSEHRASGSDRSGAALGGVLLFLIIAAVLGTIAARQRWWLPPLASAHGAEIDRLFIITFGIISVAFVLVHGVLALLVWLYRERGEGRASYWHEHRLLEAAYTIVPAVVMAGLTLTAAGLWSRVYSAPPRDALVVEVRAEQFGWKARYPGPDGTFGRIDPKQFHPTQNRMAMDRADPAGSDDLVIDISTGELHLVVNRPAEIRLRSKDVLHSFFVPAFRVKQDAVPGITVSTWFTPTRTGSYEIACAELCGVGHYVMRGKIVVQTQEEFDTWLAAQARPDY
jgi:cytochrome c oxidase subunit 2